MPESRGLPRRPFFYTLDQIADMLSLTVPDLVKSYVWRVGKEVGAWNPRFLRAADLGAGDWRVGEAELLRWMRAAGLYLYDPYLGVEELNERERHVAADPEHPEGPDDTPDADLLRL